MHHRGRRRRALRFLLLATSVALFLAPSMAGAEVLRDRDDTPGPLDLVQVKFGQSNKRLSIRLRTADPLPRLDELGEHPPLTGGAPHKYLCVRFKSHATGRRLLCPGGKLHKDRIEVGVSAVSKKGRTIPRGAIAAHGRRGTRTLSFDLNLRRLGLRPGKLSFGGDTSWYGPGCKDGSVHSGHDDRGHRGKAKECVDRVPQQNSGSARIYPLERVGCSGVSQTKVFNGSRKSKEVALTFDDGPSTYTPEVLKILADHHVKATFFEIGEQVPTYASTVDDIVAQGNEIGNHSLHHETDPGRASMAETQDLIHRASGFKPCMFRPPGGDEPSSTLEAAESLDLVSVIWDVDTEDWTLPGSDAIYSRATAVQPGSIVLMHDGGGNRSETVAALPRIIENLKSRGFHLVTMTRLLDGHYIYDEVHGQHDHGRPLPDLGPFPRFREGP